MESSQTGRYGMLTTCKLFMTDSDTKFSKSIGWIRGERTGRYAMIIDHGKITYAENEPGTDVTVISPDPPCRKDYVCG